MKVKVAGMARIYDEELWNWLRARAVRENRRASQVLEAALRTYRSTSSSPKRQITNSAVLRGKSASGMPKTWTEKFGKEKS